MKAPLSIEIVAKVVDADGKENVVQSTKWSGLDAARVNYIEGEFLAFQANLVTNQPTTA